MVAYRKSRLRRTIFLVTTAITLMAGILIGSGGRASADTTPSLSIAATAVARSVGGAVTAYFTVTLSSVQTQPVSFDYATSDGTAIAGQDYQATSGTKTIMPGQIRSKIAVKCYGINPPKHPETGASRVSFTMTISNPVGATVDQATATGKILQVPALSVGNASIVQPVTKPAPNGAPAEAFFSVSISPTVNRYVTVDYATSDNTAVAGVDYQPTSGSVLLPPGATELKIGVRIKPAVGTKYIPGPEVTTFYLTVSTPTRDVYAARTRGIGTIFEQVPPGAPQNIVATPSDAGSATVTLNWDPPSDTGNSPIGSYSYATSTDGGNTFGDQQDVGQSTSAGAPCPTGDTCEYEVFATNAYAEGPGALSAPVTGP